MSREQWTNKVQQKHDIENGISYSVSTKELTPTITVPAQGAIYLQAITPNNPVVIFQRGFEVYNEVGNQGIDLSIKLYQGCTSDTDTGNLTNYNLSNEPDKSGLKIHTNPLNVVLGNYRGDLSSAIYTESKVVSKSIDTSKEYVMQLNDKNILLIENYNTTDELEIAFSWQFSER